jgi:hypothetical protein
VRWAGLAGMLGGALFVVSAVVISSMPRGRIADACAARPMRETGAAGALLMLALFLVMGSLAMLGFNDQNAQALLAIPFGIAWVAVEYVLLSGGTTRRPARVE